MKKFYVILVVLAMVCISSMALAADVTVGGAVQIRSRDFQFLSLDKHDSTKNVIDTQERVIVDVNAKSGDVKGKISLWNDFNDWGGNSGGFERPQGVGFGSLATTDGNAFGFREAWILFPVADTGFMIKGGHQLLQLGMGGFFRSQHFGSDAWVAFRDDGPNHLGFVNVKIAEAALSRSDDTDAYVLVDTFKINDNLKFGIDITEARDRGDNLHFGSSAAGVVNTNLGGKTEAQNLGLNFTGKAGPVNLQAEFDIQMGKITTATTNSVGTAIASTQPKLKGNEIIVKGNVTMDPAAVNFTLARGTGNKAGSQDVDMFVNFLDSDPHYTFLYEYKIGNPSCKVPYNAAGTHMGFCNTTALNVGAKFAATKNLSIGADVWYMQFTEKVPSKKSGAAAGATSSDLGMEFDVKISWKLGDSLVWNWDLGYFATGDGMGNDDAMGAQGVLAYSF